MNEVGLAALAGSVPPPCACGKGYFLLGRPGIGWSSCCPWCLGFKA